jgi:DNA topoisomerase IA
MSPLLYDLTSLQRDANSRFGFSAKNTLGVAQALYEKHKVLTYPRTDSRALPEDYINTVKSTLTMLNGVTGYSSVRRSDSQQRLGEAEQAHLQQRESLGSLCDHPDHARARRV